MAIKIIKNTMEEPIEKECRNCGSIFEYNYQDIQRIEQFNFLGVKISEDRVLVCPVCKSMIYLDDKTIESTDRIATDY